MDTPPIKKSRCHRPYNASLETLFLPDELIAEILSLLNVKNILQLKCVSKSWNALISDPTFVQKHLKVSSQNPHLTLCWDNFRPATTSVVPFPVQSLLKNLSTPIYSNKFHQFKNWWKVVGSCNGLLCLLLHSVRETSTFKHSKNWFLFWNPATRTRSKQLGLLCYSTPPGDNISTRLSCFKFSFGYDASTTTYKIVAFRLKKNEASWKSEVKIFSPSNNFWRNIQSFPVFPLNSLHETHRRLCHLNDGVHLSGTINWLAMYKPITHVVQFVIVSLDLSTESYKQLLPPPGFNEVPYFQPVLRVLMDGLCLCHDSKQTEFVVWHMKEYGVHESWTQLFKISYQNLQVHNIPDGLACLYVNGDMVIFANVFCNRAFIYNLKDRTVKTINTRNSIEWLSLAMDYVESLVSVP